jgi:predicted alpha/beta hydrolase family esterase
MEDMKVMIIPGNDNTLITNNWYLYVKRELGKLGLEVIAENMPDPRVARREIWIPFIKEKLSGDQDPILIGHSTGAIAVMRFLEENKCRLAILVASYHTDLGDELESKSGYFDGPWRWGLIKKNAGKIVMFASESDPHIPISEPRLIREKTGAEYHEYKDGGHFGAPLNKREFPEIVEIVKKELDPS